MVYGIVRQNRGTITLESAPGEGAVVTIHLPAEAAPTAAPHRVPSQVIALPGGSERVLLVEDQHEVRQLAQRMLQHMGYQVEAWGNPAEALARYNPLEHPYDLVLSDVVMPEMSGPELVRRLKERGNGFAVVYMSGYAEDCVAPRYTGPGRAVLAQAVHRGATRHCDPLGVGSSFGQGPSARSHCVAHRAVRATGQSPLQRGVVADVHYSSMGSASSPTSSLTAPSRSRRSTISEGVWM
jgi:CheY-like chemotaxis protein